MLWPTYTPGASPFTRVNSLKFDGLPGSNPPCTPATVKLSTKLFGGEVSWSIDEPIKPATQPYGSFQEYAQDACLTPGPHTLYLKGAYKDGWHGAAFEIHINGQRFLKETLEGGPLRSINFDVPMPPQQVAQLAPIPIMSGAMGSTATTQTSFNGQTISVPSNQLPAIQAVEAANRNQGANP